MVVGMVVGMRVAAGRKRGAVRRVEALAVANVLFAPVAVSTGA